MNKWNPFSYPPSAVLKTIYGFLLPGVVAIGGAYARAQGDPLRPVTKYDIILALVAMFVTGGAVFGATNKTAPVNPPEENGAVGVLFIIGALLVAVGILGLLGVVSLSLPVSVIIVVIGLVCLVLDRSTVRRL